MGITISCWPTCFQLKEGGIASADKKSFAKHYDVLIQAHGTIGIGSDLLDVVPGDCSACCDTWSLTQTSR